MNSGKTAKLLLSSQRKIHIFCVGMYMCVCVCVCVCDVRLHTT